MSGPPIFILGMTPRSGTHYLCHLLRLHPDCAVPLKGYEDHLLRHAHHLRAFADAVRDTWRPSWNIDEGMRQALLPALGDGLLGILNGQVAPKRLLTMTASVQNLAMFFDLFPGAQLLILMRDGRCAVESMVQGFGYSYDHATALWARAAASVSDFMARGYMYADRYDIVRYEDLFQNTEANVRRLLSVLRLPVELYDFDKARTLPVYGSSFHRGEGDGKLHWRPVPKTPEFRPLERWHHWDAQRMAAFNETAGPGMEALGYRLFRDGAAAAAVA